MIRALSLLFIALLWVSHPASAQPFPDRAPLSGSAVDGSGKPLPGALITIRRQDTGGPATFWGAVTAADARGVWRFGQAEAGRYYLSAEVPGYAPLSNQSVDLKAGAAPLKLRFERLVSLGLKISSPGGVPLANTPIWLRLRGDGEAGQVTRRVVTDEAGNATLSELLPANYAIFLAAPGNFWLQNGLEVRADKTAQVNLQRGGTLQLSVVENGEKSRALGGATLSLTPENGAEATRALGSSADLNENVALLASGGDWLSLVSRDGDGQTEISGLPPGRYAARLLLAGFAALEPRTITIEAGQTAKLEFTLSPTGSSSGTTNSASLTLALRTLNPTGQPNIPAPGEWSLRVLPIDKDGALTSEGNEGSIFMPGGNVSRRAISDSNGQITLFPLRVGRYRVFAAPRTPPSDEGQPEAASLDVDVPATGATASLILTPSP